MSVVYKPVRVLPPPIKPDDEGKDVEEITLKIDPELPAGFFGTEGHPITHQGFRYYPAVATPYLPNILYTHSEAPGEKCGPNLLDRSTHVGISKDGTLVSPQGYCSCRANVCISSGEWYFEIKIVKSNEPGSDAHVRIGLSRREFDLSTPVGSDAYSYGFQDKGKKVNTARPKPFMDDGFKSGDVIGFHVGIPRRYPYRTPYLVRRDRFPVRFGGKLFLETLDYVATKDMNELLVPKPGINTKPGPGEFINGSFIKVYKNGEFQGTAFENIREFLPPFSKFDRQLKVLDYNDGMAGYYPTISLYRDGQAKFEMGPDFSFAKPESARPLYELWNEEIADEIVFDLVDQVHYEELDPTDTTKVQGVMPEWQDHFTLAKTARPKDEIKTEGPDTKRFRPAQSQEPEGSPEEPKEPKAEPDTIKTEQSQPSSLAEVMAQPNSIA